MDPRNLFGKELVGPKPGEDWSAPRRYIASAQAFAAHAGWAFDWAGDALQISALRGWQRLRGPLTGMIRQVYETIPTDPKGTRFCFLSAEVARKNAPGYVRSRLSGIRYYDEPRSIDVGKGMGAFSLEGIRLAEGSYPKASPAQTVRIERQQLAGGRTFTDVLVCKGQRDVDEPYLASARTPLLAVDFLRGDIWIAPHLLLAVVDGHFPFWVSVFDIGFNAATGEIIRFGPLGRPRATFLGHYPTYRHVFAEAAVRDDR